MIGIYIFEDNTRSILFYLLAIYSIILIIVEIIRFRVSAIQSFFVKLMGPLLKKNEIEKINGSIPFVLANAILVGFFPRELAIIAMVFLLFGDSAAAYFGIRYGKTRFWNGKSLEGSLAGILASIILGFIFLIVVTHYSYVNNPVFSLWVNNGLNHVEINYVLCFSVIVGAVVAFIFEAISIQGILDDNFLMPVGAAGIMMMLLNLFQGNSIGFYSLSKLLVPVL